MRRDDVATENCILQCNVMSMTQKCLQWFPKTEQWHWHVSHVWWQGVL